VKFCPPGAEIRIELESDGGHCRIKIEDNGPGIPREHMGKLFQLGFTTNGSGRGLYMTRRIAQAHGGRVDVRSKPGQGALFTFTLPSGPDEFAAAREALRKAAL
jgi:signal transduction histidine kinase